MTNYAYTILYVPNVEEALTFYEQAFGFKRKFIAPGNEYGELNTGNTALSFATVELAKSNLPDGFIESKASGKPFGIEIGFTTKDVDGMLERAVKAGATVAAQPKTKPWGQVVAYVTDPNGFLIEICTPMD